MGSAYGIREDMRRPLIKLKERQAFEGVLVSAAIDRQQVCFCVHPKPGMHIKFAISDQKPCEKRYTIVIVSLPIR
jgi:hypothetical protein